MVIHNGMKVYPIKGVLVKIQVPRVSKSKVGKRTVRVTVAREEQLISDDQMIQLGDILYVNYTVYNKLKAGICK